MKKREIRITVAGKLGDPYFLQCKTAASCLRGLDPYHISFQELGLLETQWEEFLRRTRKTLGGLFGAHKTSPLIFFNESDYIGGADAFLAWAQTSYDYHDSTNIVFYNRRCQELLNHMMASTTNLSRKYCYMDIGVGKEPVTTVVFELFMDLAPLTCKNFLELCKGFATPKGKLLGYRDSRFTRVVPQAFVQGGWIEKPKKKSIYGGEFADETFAVKHEQPGVLGMAKRGLTPNTNECQFYVTLSAPLTFMDRRYVAFGRVVQGFRAFKMMEKAAGQSQCLGDGCKVLECGLYENGKCVVTETGAIEKLKPGKKEKKEVKSKHKDKDKKDKDGDVEGEKEKAKDKPKKDKKSKHKDKEGDDIEKEKGKAKKDKKKKHEDKDNESKDSDGEKKKDKKKKDKHSDKDSDGDSEKAKSGDKKKEKKDKKAKAVSSGNDSEKTKEKGGDKDEAKKKKKKKDKKDKSKDEDKKSDASGSGSEKEKHTEKSDGEKKKKKKKDKDKSKEGDSSDEKAKKKKDKDDIQETPEDKIDRVIEELKQGKGKLGEVRATFMTIAKYLEDDRLRDDFAMKKFDEIDTDHNQVLSYDEMWAYMDKTFAQKGLPQATPHQVNVLITRYDRDANGVLSRGEFRPFIIDLFKSSRQSLISQYGDVKAQYLADKHRSDAKWEIKGLQDLEALLADSKKFYIELRKQAQTLDKANAKDLTTEDISKICGLVSKMYGAPEVSKEDVEEIIKDVCVTTSTEKFTQSDLRIIALILLNVAKSALKILATSPTNPCQQD